MRDSYQSKEAGFYSTLLAATLSFTLNMVGCEPKQPQPDKIAPDPVRQEPIGQLEQKVAHADVAPKLDLSTPEKAVYELLKRY